MATSRRRRREGVPSSSRRKGLNRLRALAVFAGLLLIAAAIVFKLLFIQVIDAGNLKRKAQHYRNHSLSLYHRGRIVDRNGLVLAQDTTLYDIFAHKDYYYEATPAQIAKALSPILNKPMDWLTTKLSEPYSTIGVSKNVPREVIDRIGKVRLTIRSEDEDGKLYTKKIRVPGLDFAKKTVRNYPQGTLAAHILGYVNDEASVSAGVEFSAMKTLKREPTNLVKSVLNGRGELVDLEKINPDNIVTMAEADDVQLTIDSRLQYLAERELAAGLERTKAKRGTVIMMDPRNGEILAFAVLPTYQPDHFYKAGAEELKNWAITDVYPPGSTFKILTVACGLESGVIDRDSRIQDTGQMKVGGWTITNYDYGKHGAPGNIDLVYLFQHSSNIASAKISMMMPTEVHHRLLTNFGMGSKTGIDIPGESAGLMNSPKSWDTTTHATVGYGYGLASTPIQMASAIAAIANKGVWVTPHLLKETPNVEKRRVLSAKTSRTITELLKESIQTAKTSTVTVEGINIAGKTGTSRKPRDDGRGYGTDLYTSFVGYYPAESPKVLMMVVVDSPAIGEAWGSTVAGPIFRAIAKESLGYLGIKTSKIAENTAKAEIKPSAMAVNR